MSEAGHEALIEAYLTKLASGLSRRLSPERVEVLIAEIRDHLELSLEHTGRPWEDDPLRLAERIVDRELTRRTFRSRIARLWGYGPVLAFSLFGLVYLVQLLLFLTTLNNPNSPPLTALWSPADWRRWVPEPLPFFEASGPFLASWTLMATAPLVLGFLLGRLAPLGVFRSLFSGLAPIVVIAFVVGFLFLPYREPLSLAFVWATYGSLTSSIAGLAGSRLSSRRTGNITIVLSRPES